MGVRVCRVTPSHSPPDRPTSGYRTIRPTWAHTDNYPLRGYKWESKFDGSPRRPLLPVVRVVFAGASSDKALSPLRDGSWGRPLLRAHSSTAHVPRLRRRLGLPGVLLARASSDWPSALFATAPGVGAHSSTCARSQAATPARIRHFLGCGPSVHTVVPSGGLAHLWVHSNFGRRGALRSESDRSDPPPSPDPYQAIPVSTGEGQCH